MPDVPPPATSEPKLRGRVKCAVVVLVLVALAVRLLVVAETAFVPQTDARDYDRHAVSLAAHGTFPPTVLAAGGGPTAFRPPLFPIVLGAVYELAGRDVPAHRWRAGRVAQAALGAVAVALLCLISLRLWGAAVALVAGAIAAVYPPLLLVGSSLMSESLFVALVLAAVLAALVHRQSSHRWRWAFAAGACVGLGALTRSNGIVLALPIAALVWVGRPRLSRRAVRGPLAVALGVVLAVAPWTIRNALVLDAFIPISTQGGYALAGTYNDIARFNARYPALWVPPDAVPRLRPIVVDRRLHEPQVSLRLRRAAVRYIEAHPGYLLEVLAWNAARTFNLVGPGFERWLSPLEAYDSRLAALSVYAFWLLMPLALLGAFTSAARRAPAALWGCPVLIVLSSILLLGATRYRAPADPFLVMLAALALVAGWSRMRSGGAQPRSQCAQP